jgi:spermidine synthase
VRRVAGAVTLAIDGKVDASNAGDMLTQKMLAHVPLMLHAHARRMAIVGLGSGVTLGAALRHPLERVDTIEISREVVEASRFFEAENHRALADPRTRLVVGDGRSHLLLSPSRYDVIVSEPSNPWMAGVATLFTREFFAAVRRALAAGGLFCQWAHAYDISSADLRSIVATFASVFPESTIWLVGAGDLLLIGSSSPVAPRLASIAETFRQADVRRDLAEVAVRDPSAVLAMYAGGPAEIARFSEGAAVQTDDRLALEFSAARGIVGTAEEDNVATLRALANPADLPAIVADAREPVDATGWRERGRLLLAAEAFDAARTAFARALAIDPADQDAVDGLIDASGAERAAAIEMLERLAAVDPSSIAVRVGLARVLAASGESRKALEQVIPVITSSPDDHRAAEQAAAILEDNGDAVRLRPLAEHIARRWPARVSGRYFIASAAFLEGRADEAERQARALVAAHPDEARLQTLLGVVSASLGHRDTARAAFNAALARTPRDAVNYTNLGLLDLEAGLPESAIGRFAEALILDPSSAAALRGLAQALRGTGQIDRATRVEQAGRR